MFNTLKSTRFLKAIETMWFCLVLVYTFQFLPISYKILMTEICFVLKHQLLVNIHLCSHHCHTVKPVLSSTVLGSHPVLSCGLLKSPVCFPSVMVIFTSIEWSNLWSGHGHLWASPNSLCVNMWIFIYLKSPNSLFVLFITCIVFHLQPLRLTSI